MHLERIFRSDRMETQPILWTGSTAQRVPSSADNSSENFKKKRVYPSESGDTGDLRPLDLESTTTPKS